MPQDLADGKSTLVQVMAWCHQVTSSYLIQCWPWSMLPYGVTTPKSVNTLRPRQNSRRISDNIFKCIFLNENIWISNDIYLKFVSEGPTDNNTALVQIMDWHRISNKLSSESMMVYFGDSYMHLTQPQWVSKWAIKFNSLLGDSEHRGPCSPYKPCNHSLYIESLSSLI